MEDIKPIRPRGHLAAVAAVIGLVALLPARPAAAQEATEVLPLEPGNAWTYDGTIWWVPRNSRRVLEERVRLEMRVKKVVERPGVRAALMAGYPRDLVTRTPNRFDGEFTLLQVGARMYSLRGERAREALQRVADPSDSLADLLPGSEIVLDLPLGEGKTFCSTRSERATGPCWFVSAEGPVERVPVSGLEHSPGGQRFVIALVGGRDHEVRGFQPGVGFTSFAIGHYGDPSALELELIDVRLATPPRPARGLFLKTLDLAEEPKVQVASASNPAERRSRVATVETTAPPATDPFPSPEPLLPERRTVGIERPAEPVSIHVVVDDLPVPVWVETRPACLDARDWYVGGSPIRMDGREFDPVGSAEPIDPDNLVPAGEFDGIPMYVGRLSRKPHMDFWLPLCGTPGTYRLYADLRGD